MRYYVKVLRAGPAGPIPSSQEELMVDLLLFLPSPSSPPSTLLPPPSSSPFHLLLLQKSSVAGFGSGSEAHLAVKVDGGVEEAVARFHCEVR